MRRPAVSARDPRGDQPVRRPSPIPSDPGLPAGIQGPGSRHTAIPQGETAEDLPDGDLSAPADRPADGVLPDQVHQETVALLRSYGDGDIGHGAGNHGLSCHRATVFQYGTQRSAPVPDRNPLRG